MKCHSIQDESSAVSNPDQRRQGSDGTWQRGQREYRWLYRDDSLLSNDQEPPLAAHLVTPRPGYAHHGIYVGSGMVVHYAGLAQGMRRGPVEECSLTDFAHGHHVWVRYGSVRRFGREEVIVRARSRVGENRYCLLTNNCEHFCEWCLRGEARSEQVEYWLCRSRRILPLCARPLLNRFEAT